MGSSGSGAAPPPGEAGGQTRRDYYRRPPTTQAAPTNPVQPSYQPVTDVSPGPPEAGAAPGQQVTDPRTPPPGPPPEVVRYGPGVPASQAGVAAESVWRTGQRPGPSGRNRGPRRMRRLLGSALTVILLIAAGVVLWLRFFDHPPFRVTGVQITQQTKTSCGVDVTGRITTNGSAGTVSYQWGFRPQTQAPQPLNQSVTAGEHAVYVTVAVEGQGHGSASQTVILQVLGPETGTASRNVTITC
jgi:hypothetical protein